MKSDVDIGIGKGVAVAGIWIAVAICSFSIGSDAVFVALLALFATDSIVS